MTVIIHNEVTPTKITHPKITNDNNFKNSNAVYIHYTRIMNVLFTC